MNLFTKVKFYRVVAVVGWLCAVFLAWVALDCSKPVKCDTEYYRPSDGKLVCEVWSE